MSAQQLLGAQQPVYLKTFLLDHSLAQNGMRVKNLEKNIQKFIGKPLILTPEFDHPLEFFRYKQTGTPAIDIPQYLKLQEKHRIGRIVSVNPLLQQATANNELSYSAVVELDTQKGINLYKHSLLPKYVSASIYRTAGKSSSDVQDFEALHLALVKQPAYGIHKAKVINSCENDRLVCLNYLAQGSNTSNKQEGIKELKIKELKRVLNFPFTNTFPGMPSGTIIDRPTKTK